MHIDRLILLLVAGAFVLSPAILDWWSGPDSSWYRPYLIWILMIALVFWVARSRDPNEL